MSCHWGYKQANGPQTWVKEFPVAAGKRQSPIDVVTKEASYDADLQGKAPLKAAYTPETDMQIKNTGHSVATVIKKKSELSGGPLEGNTYRLEQFHLHWGAQEGRGSEHTINGKSYESELHLVHYNASKYDSFKDAVDKSDGLAVIGIMIKAGEENAAFKPISDNLGNISKCGDSSNVPGSFDPAKLLPGTMTDYWTYPGSLTTPPLFESVTWILMREGIEFSTDQLKKLRSMKTEAGECMEDNYRPPVSLYSRQVKASFS